MRWRGDPVAPRRSRRGPHAYASASDLSRSTKQFQYRRSAARRALLRRQACDVAAVNKPAAWALAEAKSIRLSRKFAGNEPVLDDGDGDGQVWRHSRQRDAG